MRSEFEKWLGDVWLSDAEWDESKNTYSDSRIHCMWSAWQHQQSKVDELTKQRDSFIKAYQIEMDESVELQKRVDAALKLIPSIKAENDLWGCDQVARQIELLEQALKGGSDEIQNR